MPFGTGRCSLSTLPSYPANNRYEVIATIAHDYYRDR